MHQPRQRGPLPQDEEEQEDAGDADGVGDEVRRDAAVRVADVEGVGGVAARRVAELAGVVGRRRHGEAVPDTEDSPLRIEDDIHSPEIRGWKFST